MFKLLKYLRLKIGEIMQFLQNQPYPLWNPDQTENIPDIPNWERIIGSYTITFQRGEKVCEVHKRKRRNPNVQCGDYTIHITSTSLNWTQRKYSDKALFENLMLPNIQRMTSLEQDNFVNFIKYIYTIKIEENLIIYLNSLTLNDELYVVLYTLWHRSIIEDRCYHPNFFAGHKQILGVSIALIRKIQGKIFDGVNDISAIPYNMPEEIYIYKCRNWFTL